MSDTSDIVGYVGGGTGIVAGVVWLVKVLAGRVVAREDEDKKELQSELSERAKEARTFNETLIDIKHNMKSMAEGQSRLAEQMEKRAQAQDKEIATLRDDVKEQISQLEHRLRGDMQRLVSYPPPAPRRGKGRG